MLVVVIIQVQWKLELSWFQLKENFHLEYGFIVIKNLFTPKENREEANGVGNLCRRIGKSSFEAVKIKAAIDMKKLGRTIKK